MTLRAKNMALAFSEGRDAAVKGLTYSDCPKEYVGTMDAFWWRQGMFKKYEEIERQQIATGE